MTNFKSVILCAAVAACATSTTRTVSPGATTTTTAAKPSGVAPLTFAPALGVDLSKMTQRPSGLYVLDVAPGTGIPATNGDFVRVEYELHLANGTRIEGIAAGEKPFEFQLGQHAVIAGWEEGVTGMRAGARRKLVVPPTLGYGMRTRGNIPGGSVLVFDVHVVYVGR